MSLLLAFMSIVHQCPSDVFCRLALPERGALPWFDEFVFIGVLRCLTASTNEPSTIKAPFALISSFFLMEATRKFIIASQVFDFTKNSLYSKIACREIRAPGCTLRKHRMSEFVMMASAISWSLMRVRFARNMRTGSSEGRPALDWDRRTLDRSPAGISVSLKIKGLPVFFCFCSLAKRCCARPCWTAFSNISRCSSKSMPCSIKRIRNC